MELALILAVISSEVRNLKSEIVAGTTILDSSLRCASSRMTEDKGASFGMTEEEGGILFSMTDWTYFSALKRLVHQCQQNLVARAVILDTLELVE